MTSYTGLGLMSGTSLDGLDICCVEFTGDMNCDIWSYRIRSAYTVPYDESWRARLAGAKTLSGLELIRLHYDYAHFTGQAIQEFIKTLPSDIRVEFVAAHGHTVFHQPDEHLTFQLGDGETIASYLGCSFVTNFRAKDVAMGGQGAPLTPSGERYLYCNVGLCLNLGGIANVGAREGMAWDICPCNTVFNKLAKLNDPSAIFDKDGQLAAQGKVLPDVLAALEALDFYQQPPPKSLGVEWIDSHVWPILDRDKYSLPDLARTFAEHVVSRVADACAQASKSLATFSSPASPARRHGDSAILITGGGAHNTLVMQLLKERLGEAGITVEQTDQETVDYKEALVFAYMGLRCLLGNENVFASTTGARENNIAGSIHLPGIRTRKVESSLDLHFRSLFRRQVSISE